MKSILSTNLVIIILLLVTGCGIKEKSAFQDGILGNWRSIGIQDGSNFIRTSGAQQMTMNINKNSIVASLKCLSGTLQGVIPIEISNGTLKVLNATEMASNGSDKDCYIGFVKGQTNFEIVESHLKISSANSPHNFSLWQKID